MRVPEQSDTGRSGLFKNFPQHNRGCEITMGFEDDCHVLGPGVASQFTQRASDVSYCRGLGTDQLVSKDAHVRSAEPRSQVNETPRISELFLMFGAGIVH